MTDAARDGPFEFCLAAVDPDQLVCLDTFYVGKLRGGGAVYQLTAVNVATRWAVVRLIVSDNSATAAAWFLDQVHCALVAVDVPLQTVLTDNRPEFSGRPFTAHTAALGVAHHRTPPRSPNHNAVCECFQGTVLAKFYRPHFHRARVDSLTELDAPLQAWTAGYNRRRRNRGDYTRAAGLPARCCALSRPGRLANVYATDGITCHPELCSGSPRLRWAILAAMLGRAFRHRRPDRRHWHHLWPGLRLTNRDPPPVHDSDHRADPRPDPRPVLVH